MRTLPVDAACYQATIPPQAPVRLASDRLTSRRTNVLAGDDKHHAWGAGAALLLGHMRSGEAVEGTPNPSSHTVRWKSQMTCRALRATLRPQPAPFGALKSTHSTSEGLSPWGTGRPGGEGTPGGGLVVPFPRRSSSLAGTGCDSPNSKG